MKISVIIPTINRYTDLQNTVNDLLAQEFNDFEIIIIDQTPQIDETVVNKLKRLEQVLYIPSKIKSASAARNIGIKQSKGAVLLFIDDDVIIKDKSYLHYHYRHYSDPSINGVVGCPLELNNQQKPRYFRHKRSRKKKIGWLYFPSNFGCFCTIEVGRSNNLSVRKKLAIAARGMDENYDKGAHREEADFCLRLSNRFGPLIYDPLARLVHIGNQKGGIRSWNHSDYIRPEHHMVGAIYFFLKMGKGLTKLEYAFATMRYLLINKPLIIRPLVFFKALFRSLKAFGIARKLYKNGPIYLDENKNLLKS